jgi:hypothetical protein
MEHGLRQILETGLHAAFNVGLRGIADTQEIRPGAARMPGRLLLGSHDVEAFTAKMARWPAVRELAAALAATGLAPADPVGEAAARGLQRPTPRRRAG